MRNEEVKDLPDRSESPVCHGGQNDQHAQCEDDFEHRVPLQVVEDPVNFLIGFLVCLFPGIEYPCHASNKEKHDNRNRDKQKNLSGA
jgi:hypothetical protein